MPIIAPFFSDEILAQCYQVGGLPYKILLEDLDSDLGILELF